MSVLSLPSCEGQIQSDVCVAYRQKMYIPVVVIQLHFRQEARAAGIREVAHTLVCSTHGEGEVGWWCQSCQEPLCASCLATLHRGHPTATVAHEAPQARAILTSLLDRATTRFVYFLML